VNVPVVAVVVVAIVSVELPPACTDAGLNVPVAPAARPLTDSATGRGLPAVALVLTVNVVVAPCTTLRLVGVALMAKSLRAKLPGPPARPAAVRFARAKAA